MLIMLTAESMNDIMWCDVRGHKINLASNRIGSVEALSCL